jgi:cysteinyl-tRNA synthetase
MEDDLDTPGAVALAFDLIRQARTEPEDAPARAAAVFEIFERALGVPLNREPVSVPAEVLARAKERDQARADKDWARADLIRTELQAEGWIVEDGSEGTTIRR